MYTFHIEAVVPDVASLSSSVSHPEVVVLAAAVRASGMHVGIALKPSTPAEILFPYLDQGLLDLVRHVCCLSNTMCVVRLHHQNMCRPRQKLNQVRVCLPASKLQAFNSNQPMIGSDSVYRSTKQSPYASKQAVRMWFTGFTVSIVKC